MVRLLYTRSDGQEFETGSFEDWKIDGYMKALRAVPTPYSQWRMPNGTQISTLPDLPAPPTVEIYSDFSVQNFLNPPLSQRSHPGWIKKLWWRFTQRLR